MESGAADTEDIGDYAYLNECRARHYLQLAEKYYLEADDRGAMEKNAAYYKNQRQYILFLARLGRHRESIERHTLLLCGEPDNPMHYAALTAAYKCAGDFQKAYDIAEKGVSWYRTIRFSWPLPGIRASTLVKSTRLFLSGTVAYALDPEMIDTRYSLALHLTETGRYADAEKVWEHINGWQNAGVSSLKQNLPRQSS